MAKYLDLRLEVGGSQEKQPNDYNPVDSGALLKQVVLIYCASVHIVEQSSYAQTFFFGMKLDWKRIRHHSCKQVFSPVLISRKPPERCTGWRTCLQEQLCHCIDHFIDRHAG